MRAAVLTVVLLLSSQAIAKEKVVFQNTASGTTRVATWKHCRVLATKGDVNAVTDQQVLMLVEYEVQHLFDCSTGDIKLQTVVFFRTDDKGVKGLSYTMYLQDANDVGDEEFLKHYQERTRVLARIFETPSFEIGFKEKHTKQVIRLVASDREL